MKPIARRAVNAARPNKKQIEQMWLDLNYKVVVQEFEFVDLLKQHIGGTVFFKGFLFAENDTFDWFCAGGLLNEIDFFPKFLSRPTVIDSFGENQFSYSAAKPPLFELKSGFVVDGELARLLYEGGAYGSTYKQSPAEAKTDARIFCAQLFQEKYNTQALRYYTSIHAWNTWFKGLIIDYTYMLFCLETRTLWMLCFTDVD